MNNRINRSPTKANCNITLAELWYGKNDLSKLEVFGSKAWVVQIPKPNKLDPRAVQTVMIRYSDSG